MEICIKWNICRVCMQEEQKYTKESASGSSNQMRNLFNEDKKLPLHIYELSGIFMKADDCLPDKICRKCVSIIKNAVQFRETCRSSNVYLKSILERTKSASTLIKPEIQICKVSDDEVEDEHIETNASTVVKNEFEHTIFERQKDNSTETHEKKKCLPNFENVEDQGKEDEQGLTDNTSSDTVVLEEIIEISEEIEDQMLMQAMEDESVSFTKLKNTEEEYEDDLTENSERDVHNLEADNEELYHIFKDVKNENAKENNEFFKQQDDNRSVTDEEFEYVSIEDDEKVEEDISEQLMLHLEENTENENQAQVSSTVDTNNEDEYYEHNSNASNLTSNLDEECLDENFSSCDISSSKPYSEETSEENSHTVKTVIKTAQSPVEKRNNAGFSSRRKVQRKFFKSSGYANIVCEICGNQFNNRNLMNIHMKVHYQEKNHQCELCLKRFITSCNLQAHMRIHTGEKPFMCKYCDRRFNDRSSNIRHERTHTNEKPFECANCCKSFSLATTLQNHMKVHTNERSYRCEPCGKSFKLPHHLKTHQNTSLHRSVLQIGANQN